MTKHCVTMLLSRGCLVSSRTRLSYLGSVLKNEQGVNVANFTIEIFTALRSRKMEGVQCSARRDRERSPYPFRSFAEKSWNAERYVQCEKVNVATMSQFSGNFSDSCVLLHE